VTASPFAGFVPSIAVAPGARAIDEAAASLSGAPPPGPNSSTPSVIVTLSTFVHEKKVPAEPKLITPGTE